MTSREQRAHMRLPLEFDLSAPSQGQADAEVHLGTTANISAGGLYFHTNLGSLKSDDLLDVRLAIPPSPGVCEMGGELATRARVVRIEEIPKPTTADNMQHKYGIALQFCEPLDIRL